MCCCEIAKYLSKNIDIDGAIGESPGQHEFFCFLTFGKKRKKTVLRVSAKGLIASFVLTKTVIRILRGPGVYNNASFYEIFLYIRSNGLPFFANWSHFEHIRPLISCMYSSFCTLALLWRSSCKTKTIGSDPAKKTLLLVLTMLFIQAFYRFRIVARGSGTSNL